MPEAQVSEKATSKHPVIRDRRTIRARLLGGGKNAGKTKEGEATPRWVGSRAAKEGS
jgi:hypothetical protein